MGNSIIVLGLLLFIIGIVVNIFPKGTLPLLPGDIFVQKEHMTVYFPVVSAIAISIVLTVLINLFR